MEHQPPLEVGVRYGRWVWNGGPPLYLGRGHFQYPLTCACGREKYVDPFSVKKGKSTSCGCYNAEALSARAPHGKRKDPIYPVWNMMVQRCHNPNYRLYRDYGGRGIKVCKAWRKFENFYADMGDPPFKGATLERLKNNKGYSKGNCVWATRKQQSHNRQDTLVVVYKGKSVKFIELVESLGLSYNKVYQRIKTYGWAVERAVDTP